MEGSRHLFETAARHTGEPSFLQQLQAVHHIGSLALGLGCLESGGRKGDSREGIHGTYVTQQLMNAIIRTHTHEYSHHTHTYTYIAMLDYLQFLGRPLLLKS